MNINNLKELVKDCVYAEDGIVCMNNDYYSNILKEIERLTERYNNLKEEHIDTITRNEDYRARLDKAIDYINNCPEYLWANVNTKELLKILKGE